MPAKRYSAFARPKTGLFQLSSPRPLRHNVRVFSGQGYGIVTRCPFRLCGEPDRGGGGAAAGVEETAGCPDPRPVACLSACLATEHSLGGRPAQGQQERVVYVVAALEGQPVAWCDSYYPADWGQRDGDRAARTGSAAVPTL
jgi:hypothetical protein